MRAVIRPVIVHPVAKERPVGYRRSLPSWGDASGPRAVQQLLAIAVAGVNEVPAAAAIPSPTRPHWRPWTVDGVPVPSPVHQAMAASSPGLLLSSGIVHHGDDGTEAV